jgi:hypothetical protein
VTLRVMLVAGARPNFMKVAPVLHALRAVGHRPILVHTGQHYDARMSDAFFRDLGLPEPEHHLGVGSGTHAQQTARVMTAFEPVLVAERPDWVVVVGDVNSTLACVLVAAKLREALGSRIAHVEAGLRSHDWRMPEEVNRVLTDRLADLLLTPSRDALPNLLAEGGPAVYDTETFADLRRSDTALGGARLDGATEGVRGLELRALVTSGDTAKNAAANAAVVVQALRKSGTGGADQNLLAVRSASGVNRFILDADGNSHQDVGTAWTTFDLFDDVAVLNALAAHLTRAEDPVRDSFRHWLEQREYRQVLEKYRPVTFDENGHHFVNMSRLTMLLCGAVRQVGERMEAMGKEVLRLGREVRALRAG